MLPVSTLSVSSKEPRMGIRLCTRILLALALSPALLLPFEQVVWASEATVGLSKIRSFKTGTSQQIASFASVSQPVAKCRLMPTTFMGHGTLPSILVQVVRRLL